jgi:hypothetical protein
MKIRRLSSLIVLAILALAACEDMPAGPDALAAITEEAGAGGNGLSLRDLFAAALFQVQREEGRDAAIAVLRRWRDARDSEAENLRSIEAETVVRAFGRGAVDRASSVVKLELDGAGLAAERVLASATDGKDLQAALDSAAVALAAAEVLRAEHPERALIALQEAADQLAQLRVALVNAERFPTLEELYREALGRGGEAALRARGEEARLTADVERASGNGNIEHRYTALEALRHHRATFAVEILGESTGRELLARVARGLEELRPLLDSLDHAGANVLQDRRMLETAAVFRDRGETAMTDGQAVLALDLAAHAAGVLDELRRRRVR